MKPFVVNRYGRIVFPFNFFPELDFSIFETLEQFAAVIKRDFEEKAPSETDIVAGVDARAYTGRYDLLRDLALNLFWVNRYAMTMYEKRPTRWRDVPKTRDDVFLPVFKGWEGTELAAAIEAGYRALSPSFDEGTEDKISRILLDVFRHKKGAGAELPPIKPTVGEILSNPKNLTYHLLAYNPDYPGYGWDDIIEYTHRVPEVEALMRQAMVLHNQYRWERAKTRVIEQKTGIVERLYTELDLDHIALLAAQRALEKSGRRPEEIGAVLFCSCTSAKMMPSLATWLSGQLGLFQTHASCDLVAACAGLPYGIAEAVRLLQEVERPVLLVCGEKFSDKIGTVRTSRMTFGEGAAALVVAPAPPGVAPDIEWVQTYASGPMSEVDSIIWPNPEFDNNITVYGPQVMALVRRYLTQMIDELRGLPRPDGATGSLLDAVDLIVPHQANKTMVLDLATAAGVGPERLYFDIERVGNTSSASIPIAIQVAVREGVIDRPMRVLSPGFGAGAVAGYVVARIDPAIVAV